MPSINEPEHTLVQVSILTNTSQSLRLPPHIPPGIIEHKKSYFSPASLESAFPGQNFVITTTAGGDSKQQISIIDAAIAAGVRRFIPHEFGHDTLSEGVRKRILKSAERAKVLKYLRNMSKDGKLEWAGVATGYTLDTGLISGNLGLDIEWHSATIHGIDTETFAASSLQRVGEVVARVIAHWEEVKNQYTYAAGVLTSTNEILRSVERATRRAFTVGNYNTEECIKEGEARIQHGYLDSGMFLLERSILYDQELGAAASFELCSSNKFLQLKPELIEVIVANAYHELKRPGTSGCSCAS